MKSAGKEMGTVFWDANGITFIDYIERGRTIIWEYYALLLAQLGNEIKKKCLYLAKKKVIFHQDNESVHIYAIAMAKLHELKFELLTHPPYAPDLVLSDISLFPNMEKWPAGMWFESSEYVTTETGAYLEELPKPYF